MGNSQGDGTIKKCVAGTYQGTGTETSSKTVICGFRPSFVHAQTVRIDNGAIGREITYDSNLSEDYVITASTTAVSKQTVGESSGIFYLTDTGFVIPKLYNSSYFKVYWVAYE